jgi:hypothetical protein
LRMKLMEKTKAAHIWSSSMKKYVRVSPSILGNS